MTVALGLIYVIYFTLLGWTTRSLTTEPTTGKVHILHQTSQAFLTGVVLHVLLFNGLQWLGLSRQTLLICLYIVIGLAIASFVWQSVKQRDNNLNWHPTTLGVALTALALIGAVMLFWNGTLLPNIAWDSWVVWEGKALQWETHGLATDINTFTAWLDDENALFNYSANYPDGLSLIYFLPKLFTDQGFAITHIIYLFAYASIAALMTHRLANNGAPWYLQIFLVLVLFTTPLLSNHLMIQGYADIWVAIYLMAILLVAADYHETGSKHHLLTLCFYLCMLPLLKLEGWVWLTVLAAVWLMVLINRHKLRRQIVLTVLALVAILLLVGGIEWHTDLGDLIITHQRITLFNLVDSPLSFTDVTDQLMAGMLWQGNWGLLWVGWPFLLVFGPVRLKSFHEQFAWVFLLVAMASTLFIFYFTEASQWALDFTALNRLILQLTPSYIYLLFCLFTTLPGIKQQPDG